MKEIELSSCSRNPSRLSAANNEIQPTLSNFDSDASDEFIVNSSYEQTIEHLIHTIDRQQMTIEDYRSEDNKQQVKKDRNLPCNHDINKIRKKIWLQVTMQKGKELEKERNRFDEEIKKLDLLKEDYYNRRSEILFGIEKLKIKEQLLEEKEKQMRMQRLSFEKQKVQWEHEQGIQTRPPAVTSSKAGHHRSSSFSHTVNTDQKNKASVFPTDLNSETFSLDKHEQLKVLQTELQNLEKQLRGCAENEFPENGMKIENLKNKIATLRGEIAISESTKASRFINSVMVTLQREASRDGKKEETARKNFAIPKLKYEPLEANREKDEISTRKKALLDKEKELASREAFLQETWMRVPGAKELIENVNLTLLKLRDEKSLFEKEREDFNKERLEWMRNIEKVIKNKSLFTD